MHLQDLPPIYREELDQRWRKAWRDGVAPDLSDKALLALRGALESDDPRLIQGKTTLPDYLDCTRDFPVDGACALGFCGWQGEGLQTVEKIGEFFAVTCSNIDDRLHEKSACRWFLNWFDTTPRDEMRRELLAEVNLALEQRKEAHAN